MKRLPLCLLLLLALLWLAACAQSTGTAPGTPDTQGSSSTQPTEVRPSPQDTQPPAPTQAVDTQGAPTPQPTQGSSGEEPLATPTGAGEPVQPTVEARPHQVEIEWPPRLRLQDSDTIRLALIPSQDGYQLQAEFPDHTVQGTEVQLVTPEGYDLFGVAALEGAGFEISPAGEQVQYLEQGETHVWRWVIRPTQAGANRLAVSLALRVVPKNEPAASPLARQRTIFSRSLEVQVLTLAGLSQPQALSLGLAGVLLSGSLGLALLRQGGRSRKKVTPGWPERTARPNPALGIEPHPAIRIDAQETQALQALFGRYARLALEAEFLSGYSGARTFLALPIRPDGQADAHTIVKMGATADIYREFANYETFVKDRLPPVTARIQHPPVRLPRKNNGGSDLAALQYTFIGLPGSRPTSLGDALRRDPDPAQLWKLFESFGPHWWMQRRPYTFRMGQEYDRMLPPHYVIRPRPDLRARNIPQIGANQEPDRLAIEPGQLVSLRLESGAGWQVERREAGRSLALTGTPSGSQPALRLRWLGGRLDDHAVGEVVSTRAGRLRALVAGLDLAGLPDPLDRLESLMQTRVQGTRSILHGDLNLENALVGPGNILWLIDFAQTREGHTLFDFAHLEAEIIAHVLAEKAPSPADYLALLRGAPSPELAPYARLLEALPAIAARCLFDPANDREYRLARTAACLGALKFANLDAAAKQLLYLTAAVGGV